MIEEYLGGLELRNIWIFITDRCNLHCDYCFFSGKKGGRLLGWPRISQLLDSLGTSAHHDFVISGGEPLYHWRTVTKMIERMRKDFRRCSITLQTNSLFLTEAKIKYLKEAGIVIEPGIDGRLGVNARHRRGITAANFPVFLKKVNAAVKQGCRMNPTMAVHPDCAGSMYENFSFLVSLGLRSIDVHPALFAPWTKYSRKIFLRQYKKILVFERRAGKHLLCKNYSVPVKPSIDLVVQPDGFVLANWVFLAFPHSIRKKFFIMKLLSGRIDIFQRTLAPYIERAAAFFSAERSYRDFSNYNVSCALGLRGNKALVKRFGEYKILTEDVQLLDRVFLMREDAA